MDEGQMKQHEPVVAKLQRLSLFRLRKVAAWTVTMGLETVVFASDDGKERVEVTKANAYNHLTFVGPKPQPQLQGESVLEVSKGIKKHKLAVPNEVYPELKQWTPNLSLAVMKREVRIVSSTLVIFSLLTFFMAKSALPLAMVVPVTAAGLFGLLFASPRAFMVIGVGFMGLGFLDFYLRFIAPDAWKVGISFIIPVLWGWAKINDSWWYAKAE